MTRFNLHELGWHDLQNLCPTVTNEVLGQTVTAFISNTAAWRHGAFLGAKNSAESEQYEGDIVVQAKHTSNPSTFVTPDLTSDELDKADHLVASRRCDLYVLMSSA